MYKMNQIGQSHGLKIFSCISAVFKLKICTSYRKMPCQVQFPDSVPRLETPRRTR